MEPVYMSRRRNQINRRRLLQEERRRRQRRLQQQQRQQHQNHQQHQMVIAMGSVVYTISSPSPLSINISSLGGFMPPTVAAVSPPAPYPSSTNNRQPPTINPPQTTNPPLSARPPLIPDSPASPDPDFSQFDINNI